MDRNNNAVIKQIAIGVLVLALLPIPVLAKSDDALKTKTFGLKVTPLEYKTTLKTGKSKKGYIDISNPTKDLLEVETSVQAFRQIADDGSLEFFDSEQVSAGIQLDLESFSLPASSALRMYFSLDSTKLPSGDVYAAIFFTTRQRITGDIAVQPAIRVGSLLSIVNGTAGARQADVTGISVPLIQFGTITGSYTLKNTADPKTSTGFYPDVVLSLDPLHRQTNRTASLLFAGRQRSNNFTFSQKHPGIYRFSVAAGGQTKSTYVIILTPLFMIITGVVTLLIIASIFLLRRRTTRKRLKQRRVKRR